MGQRIASADAAIAAGQGPAWLLSLELPNGQHLRLSSEIVPVTSRYAADGPYQFQPLLLGVEDFEEELDVFGLDGIGALTQARVEIATTADLATMQGDWFHIVSMTAELSLLWAGQAWEDRLVVLQGAVVQGMQIGQVGSKTTLMLETSPPPTSDVVGDDTRDLGDEWPKTNTFLSAETITDVTGRKYVWVYGSPKSIPAYKVGQNGSAGVADWVVLCGHRLPNTGVVGFFYDGVSGGTDTPVRDTDSNGVEYMRLVGGAGDYDDSVGALTWSADFGGICRADDNSRPTLNAGQVLRRLLRDSGARVDWRACTRAFRLLAEWPIGFWIDAEANALDLIRDYLSAYLPIVEMESASGIYFAYVDPHHAAIDGDLLLGQQLLGRVGEMETSDLEAIRNSFTINYYHEASADEYTQTLTVDASNSTLCYLSQQLLERTSKGDTGVRTDDAIDCPIAWDATTARRILLSRASRLALPRRIVRYAVAPDAYWIDAGGVYRITDSTLGIAGAFGVVTAVNRSLSPYEITVEMIDRSPASRPR